MQKIKNIFLKLRDTLSLWGKSVYIFFENHPYLFCIISGFFITLLIETLCRHSIIEGLKFMILHPVLFSYGMLIVTATFSLSLLIRKGLALWGCVFVWWLTFAISNSIILMYRACPLIGSDFQIMLSVFSILTVYLSIPQIVVISLAIVSAVTGLVFLWIHCPKRALKRVKDTIAVVVCVLLLSVLTPIYLATGVLS